ncbi:MAG: hypothetical protein CMP11_01495 [Zetaproteobacteria bacterium]|nr:hypothetical protein [Pseudobdellovibrionaceae bacterium]
MVRHIYFVFVLFIGGACVSKSTKYQDVTVKNVDIDRFMGKWYVIASIPTMFEKNACNAVETYTRKSDDSIHVDFTYHYEKPSGKKTHMTQTAYVVDDETRAHWKIRPIWPLLFDYLIIDLDHENYEYTTIGRPNKANLWIMARSHEISPKLYNSLVEKAVIAGYDKTKIEKVEQNWSNP